MRRMEGRIFQVLGTWFPGAEVSTQNLAGKKTSPLRTVLCSEESQKLITHISVTVDVLDSIT